MKRITNRKKNIHQTKYKIDEMKKKLVNKKSYISIDKHEIKKKNKRSSGSLQCEYMKR